MMFWSVKKALANLVSYKTTAGVDITSIHETKFWVLVSVAGKCRYFFN